MNDNNTQNIDLAATAVQIDTLKRQRNAANDDVAVLFGQVESLKATAELKDKEIAELRKELNERNSNQPGDQTPEGQAVVQEA